MWPDYRPPPPPCPRGKCSSSTQSALPYNFTGYRCNCVICGILVRITIVRSYRKQQTNSFLPCIRWRRRRLRPATILFRLEKKNTRARALSSIAQPPRCRTTRYGRGGRTPALRGASGGGTQSRARHGRPRHGAALYVTTGVATGRRAARTCTGRASRGPPSAMTSPAVGRRAPVRPLAVPCSAARRASCVVGGARHGRRRRRRLRACQWSTTTEKVNIRQEFALG